MNHSKRRFFKLLGLGTLAALATVVLGVRWQYPALRRWLYRLDTKTPAGALSPPTSRTLMAVVDTLVGAPFERQHYQEFFSWYAANVPGYRDLYERATAMLDRRAMGEGGDAFAELEYAKRRHIVDRLLRLQTSALHKAWAATVNRDALLFDRYMVQAVLRVYRETDAWVHLGYGAWRGQPRGLDRYRRALRTTSATAPARTGND